MDTCRGRERGLHTWITQFILSMNDYKFQRKPLFVRSALKWMTWVETFWSQWKNLIFFLLNLTNMKSQVNTAIGTTSRSRVEHYQHTQCDKITSKKFQSLRGKPLENSGFRKTIINEFMFRIGEINIIIEMEHTYNPLLRYSRENI